MLRAVVDHHVSSAAPVGSSVLARHYVANVSPATIRNELGALETQELLFQPYTSAGRLPTQAGYRRVVDDILQRPALSRLAHSAQANYPNPELHLALRKFSALGSSLLLAELFRAVVMHLAAATNNLALMSVPRASAYGSTVAGSRTDKHLYYNGLANLLRQPEFLKPSFATAARTGSELPSVVKSTADSVDGLNSNDGRQESFACLVGMLENEARLIEVLEICSHDNRVLVSIGDENCDLGLSDLSLITSRYRGGVVAVIGPTRMNYREAISAVSTAAHTLDDILE